MYASTSPSLIRQISTVFTKRRKKIKHKGKIENNGINSNNKQCIIYIPSKNTDLRYEGPGEAPAHAAALTELRAHHGSGSSLSFNLFF